MEREHHSPSASDVTRIVPNSLIKVSGMGEASDDALSIRLEQAPLAELIDAAGRLRDEGHGRLISYSRKVFIPLTHLCRDVCHYCTFAERPRAGKPAYLSRGRGAGDRPRRRGRRLHGGAVHARRQAGAALSRGARGAGRARPRDHHRLSSGDVRACAARDRPAAARQSRSDEPVRDRRACATVTASQGIMLESLSARLCEPGGVHYGSPDKRPEARLETLRLAGELQVFRSPPAS